MDPAQLKKLFRATFDAIAEGYGHSAMRVFYESAGELFSRMGLKEDAHVLDVATGTGHAARAIAKALPGGRVTGIDFFSGHAG